jgi:uncharacterized protein YjbI with pentapeptide repeats
MNRWQVPADIVGPPVSVVDATVARMVEFSGEDLSGSRFFRVDLAGSRFQLTQLGEVEFLGCEMDHTRMHIVGRCPASG